MELENEMKNIEATIEIMKMTIIREERSEKGQCEPREREERENKLTD